MNDIYFTLFLLALGYTTGTIAERRHYNKILRREEALKHNPIVSFSKNIPNTSVGHSTLVTGSAVVSLDYFKRLLAALRIFIGGNVSAYESLIDRARREALLRMREQAPNADVIYNVRIETSSIGKSANTKRQIGSIEALAYGTAVSFNSSSTSSLQ